MENFAMSPDVWDYIENEFLLLNRLIEKHQPLIYLVRETTPDDFQVSALGAMLQSFYGGVENLFKRIALDIDGEFSKSDSWHKNLLDRMTTNYNNRPAVISEVMRRQLHKYLDFRHVFRSVYSYDLNWSKMQELVAGLDETMRNLTVEFDSFKASFKKNYHK
jgi:hypothetical protein